MAKNAGWIVAICVTVGAAMFFAGTFFPQQQVEAQMGGGAGDLVCVAARDNAEFPTLFVIDTKVRHLAVYKAETSTQRLKLVATRNIDWDLQVPTQFPPATSLGSKRDPSVMLIRQAVLEALKNEGR